MSHIEVDNPRFKCAPKMKLFPKKIINEIADTDFFKELQESRKKRKEGAQKAVATKIDKLNEQIDIAIKNIKIQKIGIDELRHLALESKRDWYDETDQIDRSMNLPQNPNDVDYDTMTRWSINYVRHNLMEYDETLYEMEGKVGCHDAYTRYRRAVDSKISSAYHKLFKKNKKRKVQTCEEGKNGKIR